MQALVERLRQQQAELVATPIPSQKAAPASAEVKPSTIPEEETETGEGKDQASPIMKEEEKVVEVPAEVVAEQSRKRRETITKNAEQVMRNVQEQQDSLVGQACGRGTFEPKGRKWIAPATSTRLSSVDV